jgi:acyl-CoA dehydrogenase
MESLSYSAEVQALKARVFQFIETEVIPREKEDFLHDTERFDALIGDLRAKAKAAGIYLPHLPAELGGLGLNWRDTAVIFEEAGRSLLGPRALNAAAPDDGNMRTLNHLCTPEQRERYLKPLAEGSIRSCFAMTEPMPGAGSDPSLLLTTAEKRGGQWIINGKKWFITGAEGATFAIVLAKTGEGATMFLVDTDNPGFKLRREISTLDSFSPGGHCEIDFVDCAVDESAVLGEAGKGLEHAQLRLAPARLTHCMRWLGVAVRATEIATDYASRRDSFGKKLKDHQAIQTMVSDSHIDILASRLMIQHVAAKLDSDGPLKSKHESSLAKVFVSEAVDRAVDRAVQICGALGVSEDTPLSHFYRDIRPFRIYDGANEVHRMALARRIFHKRLRP